MSVRDARQSPHAVFYRVNEHTGEVVCCWCFLCKRECPVAALPTEIGTGIGFGSIGSSGRGSVRAGLVNLGNTCYANACIQALAACDALRLHVLDDLCAGDDALPDEALRDRRATAPLTYVTGELLRRLASGGSGAVEPKELLEHLRFLKPSFDRGSQHDAMECVRALLDGLHEENKYMVRKRRRVSDLIAAEPVLLPGSPLLSASSSPPSTRAAASPVFLPSPLSRSMARSSPAKSPPAAPAHQELEEQSVVSCICSGLLLSRVFCSNCKNVSDTVDPFTDLPAPIPQEEHLRQSILVTRKADDADERAEAGEESSSSSPPPPPPPKGWLEYAWSWVAGAPAESLTLMDCLYAFFREEKLSGDNQYRCGACKTLSDAHKSYYLLALPEVLCVHLKRFRHDLYGVGKLNEHVEFPLERLDLRRFYPEHTVQSPLLRANLDRPGGSPPRPNAAPRSSRRPQALHRDVRDARDATGADLGTAPYDHPTPGTTFALGAIIVHVGQYGSGHYIAYSRSGGGVWHRYDDSRVLRVDESEVRACDAYVLFYSKQTAADAAPDDRSNVVALSEAAAAPDCYYLPAQWWQRWLRLGDEPGPIDNESLVCAHGHLKSWLAHGVPRVVWEQVRDKHGVRGGALRSGTTQHSGERVVRGCDACARDEQLRQHCAAIGAPLLRAPLPSTARHYLLPVKWLRAFNSFVLGSGAPPPRIDVAAEVNGVVVQSRSLVAAVSHDFVSWACLALGLSGEPLFVVDAAAFREHFRSA
jgi:ubiquitin carboxyl-terminal hydrolase 20/33